jgi:hypothetical protein
MTDPRLDKADYLFDPDNPFAPHRITWTTLVTLIRGYLTKIWAKLTDPDKQILVPTPLYLDGCVTGQFANLAIAQFKMTIGIINQKARDKAYFGEILP